MKRVVVVVLTLAASTIGAGHALASPEFIGYEGKNAVHEGQGGEKKTVNGVDFWFNGDPPRRFKVLGSVSDRRMKTGLYGIIRMSGLEYDIAKAAAAAGGDAVILQSQGDDLLGVSGIGNAYATSNGNTANAFGSSFSAPVKAHESRYVVVKYLPDDSQAAATSGTNALPSPIKAPEPSPSTVNVAPPN